MNKRVFRFEDEAEKPFIQKGTKIRFPKNNQISFGQDFKWFSGVPSDRDFWVDDVMDIGGKPSKVAMKAFGYGLSMKEAEELGIDVKDGIKVFENDPNSNNKGCIFLYSKDGSSDWGNNAEEFFNRCKNGGKGEINETDKEN